MFNISYSFLTWNSRDINWNFSIDYCIYILPALFIEYKYNLLKEKLDQFNEFNVLENILLIVN